MAVTAQQPAPTKADSSHVAAKLGYGVLFTIVLPVLLMAWAHRASVLVPAPVPHWPAWCAWTVVAVGAVVMLAGMAHLRIYGHGLPMNAFPPPMLVTRGLYRLLPHPIYTGFCAICVGMALATRSAGGLWLVSPMVMLGAAALVLGYERPDLEERFGPARGRLCVLPEDDASMPTMRDRIAAYVFVLLPWLAIYEAVVALGVPRDAIPTYLPFESRWPVVEWTELFYVSTYVIAGLAPLVAVRRCDLRRFMVRGLFAMTLAFALMFALPLTAPPRAFVPAGTLGRLLQWERAYDAPVAAFPSFHVIWALLAAEVYAARWQRLRRLWHVLAAAVAVSCVTTGMHSLIDVAGGVAAVMLVANTKRIWDALRRATEHVANSWHEWRIGSMRIINHGFYAGAGVLLGMIIIDTLLGPEHELCVFVTTVGSVIGAALWAQWIEGSPRLLRPFGFYGGVAGIAMAAIFAPLMHTNRVLLLAAFCVAAPWIQSWGRLRCLVQGCCHGRPASEGIGIRYLHPRSRVCRLSEFARRPLHATPLYSILWNTVIALILTRLWTLHTAAQLIIGIYLLLMGIGRFVEESYRGEPQTPKVFGLRLYQWLAVISVVAGALVTSFGSPVSVPEARFTTASLLPSLIAGMFVSFALGVDFPQSNRRFARLA